MQMPTGNVSAEVISCPGRLGDAQYTALQVNVEGFNSPYVLTLAMPALGFRALSEQVDTAELYRALAHAINVASVDIAVSRRLPKANVVADAC